MNAAAPSAVPAGRDALSAWDAWHREREQAVAAVPGNLALVAYQRLTPVPTPIEQVPSVLVSADPAGGGALVSARVDDGVELDGVPVDGTVGVPRLHGYTGPLLHAGRWWFDVFSLSPDRSGSDELRVYDEQSPALSAFGGIDAYAYDEAWVLDATFTASVAPERVPWVFTREADTGQTKQVPGGLRLAVDGEDYELLGFLDGEAFVVTFADATSGTETYGPGRFLRMPRPGDGEVVVDLNRAFLPPCAFSDSYSCPLPPPGNRIAAPVRAGERTVLWRPGTSTSAP